VLLVMLFLDGLESGECDEGWLVDGRARTSSVTHVSCSSADMFVSQSLMRS
jgi:hypothetical protein